MGEAAVKEPSMEDILSSIRKIISEEGSESVAEQTAPSVSAPSVEAPVQQDDAAPAPQMADVLEQVRASTSEAPAVEESVVASVAPEDTSGNQAAKMAASLASIAETVKAEPAPEPIAEAPAEHAEEEAALQQSVWDEVAEPAVSETIAAEPEAAIEMPSPVEVEAVSEAIAPQEAAPSLASIAETVVEQVEVPEAPVAEAFAETPFEAPAEPEIHVEMAEATPAPAVVEPAPATMESTVETMVEEELAFKGALMSPSADNAVASSLDRLKRSAMDDIDAKVEAVIRPMLREWLDENLPNMVERLVREEIERVARG